MIIDEDDDEGEKPTIGDALAGSAYQTALTSVDGMSRDARGRLKLNKATKRGRALEAENDVDMLEGILDDDTSAKKKAKRAPEKLGSEFRSKVNLFCFSGHVLPCTDCSFHLSVLEGMSNLLDRTFRHTVTFHWARLRSKRDPTRSILRIRSVAPDSDLLDKRLSTCV
jgi:hypothetical protein